MTDKVAIIDYRIFGWRMCPWFETIILFEKKKNYLSCTLYMVFTIHYIVLACVCVCVFVVFCGLSNIFLFKITRWMQSEKPQIAKAEHINQHAHILRRPTVAMYLLKHSSISEWNKRCKCIYHWKIEREEKEPKTTSKMKNDKPNLYIPHYEYSKSSSTSN